MGNSNSQIKQNIQEGIPLIKEWIETKRKEYEDNTDFNELTKVINDIEKDKDYSNDAYEEGMESTPLFLHHFSLCTTLLYIT